MNQDYWKKQSPGEPLFPDVEWNKPERKDQAGKLGIIGGNKLGFAATAESYQVAKDTGAGEVRILLPDALKKTIPPNITDALFAPTNHSGGLATEAESEIRSLVDWSDAILLPGDAGKNSQTAILYESLISKANKPTVVTRDAVDLVQNSFTAVLENPNTVLIASFAQVQRIFKSVYYPKILTFSMQLSQVVETLHKFTLTYPATIVTLHAEQIIIAQGGEVVTQKWHDPMRIWRGHTAARAASFLLWTPQSPIKAISSSLID